MTAEKLEVQSLAPMGGAHVFRGGAICARFADPADAHEFAAAGMMREACKKALTCASMDSAVRAVIKAALAAVRVPEGG